MPDLLEWIREHFATEPIDDGEEPAVADQEQHAKVDKKLDDLEGELRLARIDAGLPVDRRRHRIAAGHPQRRQRDEH